MSNPDECSQFFPELEANRTISALYQDDKNKFKEEAKNFS
jgi:hypothetical protein